MTHRSSLLTLIETTGEWCDAEEFRRPTYLTSAGTTMEAVEATLDFLKPLFPAKTVKEAYRDRDNGYAFLFHLMGWVLGNPIPPVLVLAAMLRDLDRAVGFAHVRRDLRARDPKSRSAWVEARLAHILQRHGFTVRFPRPSPHKGKTPDIIAGRVDTTLAIECKDLVWHQRDELQSVCCDRLSLAICASPLLRDKRYEIVLEPQEDGMPRPGGGGAPVDAWVRAASARVLAAVAACVADGSSRFSLPGLAHGTVMSGGPAEGSFVGLPPRCTAASMRKMIDAIKLASNQLDRPGLAVVVIPELPDLAFAQTVFSAATHAYAEQLFHCTAAIILPWDNVLHGQRPMLLVNSRAAVTWANLEPARAVGEVLGV